MINTTFLIDKLDRYSNPVKCHVNKAYKFDYFWTPKDLGHFLDNILRFDWTLDRTSMRKFPNITPLIHTRPETSAVTG